MSAAEERLADALRAEHAAIYAYGAVGAHLDGAALDLAVQAEAAHRARRDALVVRLSGANVTPPPAEPAYALPSPVTDAPSALTLALTVEERTAVVWHAAVPDTTAADRKLAVEALSDCAVRATRVRRATGVQPSTVPFPGKP
jgi:hypothetical protein